MKILLLGEYSNVHATLAEGLRAQGHHVTVVSDGDGWKNYPRDIDLTRCSLSRVSSMKYYVKAWRIIMQCRGYDVVQIINPMFLELKAHLITPFYRYLRRHNKVVVMGAYGMDYYWVRTCLDCTTFRYSDFNIASQPRTEEAFNKAFIAEWMQGAKRQLNEFIANDCDAIIAGLCEYYMCYTQYFPQKTHFIPMPIHAPAIGAQPQHYTPGTPLRVLIGIQRGRSEYKGTDIMLRALLKVKALHPDKVEVVKVESMPFFEYRRLMSRCHVIIDQLYSYTPAMNALEAMSRGVVVVGGGEPENYDILHESELRPIVNVQPNEEDCVNQLEALIAHPEQITQMALDSMEYIRRHHDHLKVARQYAELYARLIDEKH